MKVALLDTLVLSFWSKLSTKNNLKIKKEINYKTRIQIFFIFIFLSVHWKFMH